MTNQSEFVQARRQRSAPLHFCKRPAPLTAAGRYPEREMVSSRSLLITGGCASRCNRIPAATPRKEEDVHLFV